MKTAILSDVHSNVDALEAVLEDVESQDVDQVVCLGDSVGYGAQPRECLDLLFDRCCVIVAGNHDLAVAGTLERSRFNELARA
ncbi:MAG: metallophosphoesterase, partial [Acidobacteria bacterium]|nr:metallophosphoesterase [Acidobacteriota bacterium]